MSLFSNNKYVAKIGLEEGVGVFVGVPVGAGVELAVTEGVGVGRFEHTSHSFVLFSHREVVPLHAQSTGNGVDVCVGVGVGVGQVIVEHILSTVVV
jgi:hypothetical protein